MELRIEQLSATVTKAAPIGRWDIVGAGAIDLRLNALAGSGRSLIIDMTEVSFLSSMGIRSIVMSAKAVALRNAKLVLMSPGRNVELVLTSTGIETLAPICHGLAAALAAIEAGQGRSPP
ncbi:MAG TPA: STAS domain-containing protein [Stellaceae bacterium]|nr:STAS domain-containing protein [Stellaceae bacterium]